jgi:mono/diheme cytochrome c family protein
MKVKAHVRGMGVAAVLAAGALGGCGKSNEAGPAVAVDIEGIYAQMCARCHGADGRGDPEMKKTIPGIRDFADPQFRAKGPEEVESVIMTGRNQMPGFGAALTRPKLQHLAGHVRRLGALAAASPPAPAPADGVTVPGAGHGEKPGAAAPAVAPKAEK